MYQTYAIVNKLLDTPSDTFILLMPAEEHH